MVAVAAEQSVDVIDLDRARAGLGAIVARKARVVELEFVAGLSVEETTDVLHVSADTIKRDSRLSKLWLLRAMEGKRHD